RLSEASRVLLPLGPVLALAPGRQSDSKPAEGDGQQRGDDGQREHQLDQGEAALRLPPHLQAFPVVAVPVDGGWSAPVGTPAGWPGVPPAPGRAAGRDALRVASSTERPVPQRTVTVTEKS